MKVIYVAGPDRAANAWLVEQNVRNAEIAGYEISCMGAIPLIPHSMTRFFDRTHSDEYWLEATMELMRRCDAVFFLATWRQSKGSVGEWNEAGKICLPRFETFYELQEWLKAQPNSQYEAFYEHRSAHR